jgi:hypothetical protein
MDLSFAERSGSKGESEGVKEIAERVEAKVAT